MKKGWREKAFHILEAALVVAILLPVLSLQKDVTERKNSRERLGAFYHGGRDYDVLTFGSSHMLYGFSPMALWEDYGITSYNLGSEACNLAQSYWILRDALHYASPQAVIIDGYLLKEETKISANYSYVHYAFDAMPFSLTKVQAVYDLLDDPSYQRAGDNSSEEHTPIGLLWDYSVYHSRWSELSEGDFRVADSGRKGAQEIAAIHSQTGYTAPVTGKLLDGETTGVRYLRKAFELCRSNGIKVVVTYLPFEAEEEDVREANRLSVLCEEYGIPFINFLELDLTDPVVDQYDAGHLNIMGGRKITDFIGNYLIEQDLPERGQEVQETLELWEEDDAEYRSMENRNMKAKGDLFEYCLYLYNQQYNTLIDIHDPALFQSQTMVSLLAALGVDSSQISGQTSFILLRGDESPIVANNCPVGTAVTTEDGIIVGRFDGGSGEYGIYINGDEFLVEPVSKMAFDGLRILTWQTGEDQDVVDDVNFTYVMDGSNIVVTEIKRPDIE